MIPKELIKKIKTLEIKTRHIVTTTFSGQYHSAFKGRGINFSEVREYTPEDDHRLIDWKVTARTGTPHIKLFEEERELTVILAIDISGSSEFGSQDQTKRQLMTEIAAIMAFSAIRNNDKVGLLLFSEELECYIPPKKGKVHVLRLIRDILYKKPKKKGTNIKSALEFLSKTLKRKAIVFLISDFLDHGYEKHLKMCARRHDVVPIVVEDKIEKEWPKAGIVALEDAETGEILYIDSKNKEAVHGIYLSKYAQLEQLCRSIKLTPIWLEASEPYMTELVQFFEKRMRQ